MTRDEFIRLEGRAFRAFLNRFEREDFLSASVPVYGRSYRCECGFMTRDSGVIFDHAVSHGEAPQGRLF